MHRNMKKILGLILLMVLIGFMGLKSIHAQSRLDSIAKKLEEASAQIPGLNHPLELSVSDTPIKDFIRNMATVASLNINLDNGLNQTITNNFVDVPAKDVLLFLCKNLNLDLTFSGKIINVSKYVPSLPPPVVKKIKIFYDSINSKFTLDLKDDDIAEVAREITRLSNSTVICSPEMLHKTVSLYVRDLCIDEALDKLALSNQLEIVKSDSLSFHIKGIKKESKKITDNLEAIKPEIKQGPSFSYEIYDKSHIDIFSLNRPMDSIIDIISKELNLNYFVNTKIEGKINLNLINVSYDELLTNMFNGTKYTFNTQDGIYLIGERSLEGLRETKVIQLMYRSVDKISELIPETLKKDVSVSEFPELNSLIASGSRPVIKELEQFIAKIDKVIPLILIEVIIIDNQSGYTVATGISAGINDEPVKSGGSLFTGVDYTLGGESINRLLNSFNGFGSMNLGKVNPNFYLSVKALEEAGVIKVRSTPKLSTLNGHEANLTIGNTEYYLDEQSSLIVNQSTQQNTVSQYKPVKADFILTIFPVAGGNDEITLDIVVEQSDFTGRISENAPPGLVTRKFTSMIRVKNEDMVLLGGLEEKRINNTSRGVPFLSRVPILKWIFSSRNKEKKESKLNVFIKPTIIY